MKEYWFEFKYIDTLGEEIHKGIKITELLEFSLKPDIEEKESSEL